MFNFMYVCIYILLKTHKTQRAITPEFLRNNVSIFSGGVGVCFHSCICVQENNMPLGNNFIPAGTYFLKDLSIPLLFVLMALGMYYFGDHTS